MDDLTGPADPGAGDPVEVEAAGAILVDRDGRICVVHRARYDDWSLPKGKLERGETHHGAAVREVAEETGFVGVVERWVDDVAYLDRRGRRKRVRYAEMSIGSGRFEANDEVDALEFVEVAEAIDRLTYRQDAELVERWAAQRGG